MLIALGTTVMGASAVFGIYTYVAPILQEVTMASESYVHRDAAADRYRLHFRQLAGR